MKKRTLSLAVSAVLWLVCAAQTSVKPIEGEAVFVDGIAYSLPKMEARLVATAECVVKKVGPFYKYAERYLGVSDVVLHDDCAWHLVDVALQTRFVPDENKRFWVSANSKTTANRIQLSDDGVLLAVNQIVDEQPCGDFCALATMCGDTLVAFDMAQLGEDALVATSIPKMAELAAKQIYQIRESRANLLFGENEQLPDGVALQTMLCRLDAAERELVALFVGKTAVCRVQRAFALPLSATTDGVVLRVSRQLGLVSADNLIGEPIYATIQPQFVDSQTVRQEKQACGIFYNVPGRALVTITDGEAVLVERTLMVPQFGAVNFLPASLFDRCATKVAFSQYGTIKSLSE